MSNPLGVNLDSTLGAVFMGFVFNLLLSGAALYQTASYFDNFRSDHRRYKFAVAIVGIINLTDTICIISGSYYYVITNFGNYLNLLKTDWQLAIHSALQCSSVFIVLCLFAYRSYVVSGRKLYVALLIVACATIQLAFGISVTIKEFELEFFGRFHDYELGFITQLVAAALGDILVLASHAYFLRSAIFASKQDSTQATHRLRRIVINVFRYNLATSIVALVHLATFVGSPNTLVYVLFAFVTPRMHEISMLTLLNNRSDVVSRGSHDLPYSANVCGSRIKPSDNNTSPYEKSINLGPMSYPPAKAFLRPSSEDLSFGYPMPVTPKTPNRSDYKRALEERPDSLESLRTGKNPSPSPSLISQAFKMSAGSQEKGSGNAFAWKHHSP